MDLEWTQELIEWHIQKLNPNYEIKTKLKDNFTPISFGRNENSIRIIDTKATVSHIIAYSGGDLSELYYKIGMWILREIRRCSPEKS